MNRPTAAVLCVLAVLVAGCTDATDQAPQTPPQHPTSSSPDSAPSTPGRPATTAAARTAEVPTPPQGTRAPPTAGYQCLEGDAAIYDVCADHEAWLEGQREYARCLEHDGTWDVRSQACVHRPSTAASNPDRMPSDPEFRDSNGETYEEYCARTKQPLHSCAAG
ncbi:hypothetical protein [Prauserella alba]|uniref:Chitin binding Peritrophin-A domain-containing protein n=1 Tax=Prauserella alba TaxID=176898 RepID=A0ABN1VF97_9PSEU|nr:hypothetical protein [Prauserella alba]MCP2180008.1 hypothetical protein [Prauserella alba]